MSGRILQILNPNCLIFSVGKYERQKRYGRNPECHNILYDYPLDETASDNVEIWIICVWIEKMMCRIGPLASLIINPSVKRGPNIGSTFDWGKLFTTYFGHRCYTKVNDTVNKE